MSGYTLHDVTTAPTSRVFWESLGLRRGLGNALWELTKPRLSLLSVITAIVGYLVANPEKDFETLACLLLGTSFAAGGAGVLNQWMERLADSRMVRTQDRPLPSGQVLPVTALLYGLFLSILGVGLLWAGTNALAVWLAVATLVSYLVVYTPLKTVTQWSTIVGAIPGALPPLIGCAAARGNIDTLGWILFAMLFAWQIPHFMAIAWTYREDYARGKFAMATVVDPSGKSASWQSIVFSVVLLVVSLLPYFLGFATLAYELVALASGLYFLWQSIVFSRAPCREQGARKLFFTSIAYLPLVLATLVLDRWLLL